MCGGFDVVVNEWVNCWVWLCGKMCYNFVIVCELFVFKLFDYVIELDGECW